MLIEIFAVKICEEFSDSKIYKLFKFLPEDKVNKVQKLLKWKDRERTVVGDILIRTLAQEKLKLKNKDIVFSKNEYGKPYLEGKEEFNFNISHSGDWVICAIDCDSVGIDIEEIKPIDFDIARQVFTESELKELDVREGFEKLEYFYSIWTAKESYVKALGKGLFIPLDTFEIVINDDEAILNDCKKDFLFKQYNMDSNYKVTVCSKKKEFSNKTNIRDYGELIEKYINLENSEEG